MNKIGVAVVDLQGPRDLVEKCNREERLVEADRFRCALLASISHDLRTPLAAVLGAAQMLRALSGSLDAHATADLVATIVDEGERLNRFISNLLDMTRLESGAIMPNMALYDLSEIIGSATARARTILAKHRIEVFLARNLPMVEVDPILFEQVLFNVLDNASKYAPTGTTVRIQSWRDRHSVGLQVLDEGDGIPHGGLEHIFDKFYRVKNANDVRAGVGLGLAICRGFVEAMGGTVTAANRKDRTGASFTIVLPIPGKTQKQDTDA